MTTSIETQIEAALFGRVKTLATSPAMTIAWPNNDFTPPDPPAAYLQVQHLPNRLQRPFLSGADPSFRQGILQLTVVAPLLKGPDPATALAGAVAAHFPADLALYEADMKLTVQAAPDMAPAFKTDTGWNVPVSVRYQAFA